jgi:hypothetical protein
MPKRFESPVELPSTVFEGLEAVQETGQTNMLDYQAVAGPRNPNRLPRGCAVGCRARTRILRGVISGVRSHQVR